jgi:stage III sporulation protein AH
VTLNKEQTRAKNKEALLEIVNNENISSEQKQDAIDTMVSMTTIAEKENAAETLLKTKGFENSVVSITDGSVDVVIGKTQLSDAERAQVEDIVKRKTDVSVENITISLMPGSAGTQETQAPEEDGAQDETQGETGAPEESQAE